MKLARLSGKRGCRFWSQRKGRGGAKDAVKVPSGHMDARTAHHHSLERAADLRSTSQLYHTSLFSPYLMGGGPPAELSNYDDISTRSEDSMVEIVQSTPQHPDTAVRYVLVYSKSKVYVHPTAFSRDNIPGFVAIVKKVSLVVFSAWAISPTDLKPCNP